ncbi:hypothetical protein FHY19_000134 [Xanthomonas arboricola]|nr:hypothetical protein [Xanthomonas sp. 4461]
MLTDNATVERALHRRVAARNHTPCAANWPSRCTATETVG